MSHKYNAFAGETWDVDNLEWFNGFVITKSLKVVKVRLAHPVDPEVKEKCVLVLYDHISMHQPENLGKYVLLGSTHWDTTKEGIQLKIFALEQTHKHKENSNGTDDKQSDKPTKGSGRKRR